MVQFTATWCVPCRQLTPRLEEVTNELDVKYYKVDVDENSDLAIEFQIMSVPTLQYYKDGKLVDVSVGTQNKPQLRERFSKLS